MNSLFLVNSNANVFLEKHWKKSVSKDILRDCFLIKLKFSLDIPPVLEVSKAKLNLVQIKRKDIYFVSVCKLEVPPLLIIESLHRTADIFSNFFNTVTEEKIIENYVLVYELLDEMFDNGFPTSTESNFLRELINPTCFLKKISNSITGKSNLSRTLPKSSLSDTPWRKSNVYYANNEIYFDIIEKFDALIDNDAEEIISSEISGIVSCDCKLSGIPNLLLSFANWRLFDDVSFHQCVRMKRWESEKVLSFVPPDRKFILMTYIINTQQTSVPININYNLLSKTKEYVKMSIKITPKNLIDNSLENVRIEVPFSKDILNCNFIHTHGKAIFNQNSKLLTWYIGKVVKSKVSNIYITLKMAPNIYSFNISPTINVQFTIPGVAVSDIKISKINIYEENNGINYRPFKGVKYETKAGNFHIRL